MVTVPGLRGPAPDHWQTRLAAALPNVRPVEPIGRDRYDLDERVAGLQQVLDGIDGPVILVAHSAGVVTTMHWAARHHRPIQGALLATPPDLASPLPREYPTLEKLRDNGWLPIPTTPLWFPSIVVLSTNDPLGNPARLGHLADSWGSRLVNIGAVGHLNPASGYGEWPLAIDLVHELASARTA
jgi:predicted alpha/beta hydrolase family esterase